MKHWIDYLENEEGKTVISHSRGLIAFNIYGKEVYITDFYVDKDYRDRKIGLNLARQAVEYALKKECNLMSCNIFINKKNKSEFSNKVRLFSSFGFLPERANGNTVTMLKEI